MSEVEYSLPPSRPGETNPALAPTPEQTGFHPRSRRVVRSIGNPGAGAARGTADRSAEPGRNRHAGATSPRQPGRNRDEGTTAPDKTLGNRRVRALHWPRNIDPLKLTPDALTRLATGSRSATGASGSPVHAPQRDEVLRNLREDVQQEFKRERAAAWSVAEDLSDGLTIDDATKNAIKNYVVHDDVPAALVLPLAKAYLQIRDELGSLGDGRAGVELETKMRAIRNAMAQAFHEAGLQLNSENRDRAYRMFWRFVLAPSKEEQTQGIAVQLSRAGSPLRALGEGATWYRNECRRQQAPAQSRRAERRPLPVGEAPVRTAQQPSRAGRQAPASPNSGSRETSTVDRQSLETATDYSLMMRSLADVLREKTGSLTGGLGVEGNADLTDQAIAILRNLGIPMPAPRRLGKRNDNTPISEPGLAAIRGQLDEHLRARSAGRFSRGVSVECIEDVRHNTYFIESQPVPRDYESVTDAIAAFCSFERDRLNPHLLRNLSMLAYRGGFDCVRETCLNNGRPDIALFSEDPVLTEVEQAHRLWRDGGGDVILESRQVGNVQQVKRQDANGVLETVDLDPESSTLDLTVRFRFDRATCKPALEGVSVRYAFIPAARTPGHAAATEETASGL